MTAFTPPADFTTRPLLRGSFGMAASTHATATAVAQAVLERGGNAFDAVCAGGFVLHIVEPHLNGPGGDLVGLFRPADGDVTVLMGQGPAPAGATAEHVRGEGLDLVPGAGGLAAAVPGAVDAWLLLLRDHGTWELADVLSFAIGYAHDGHHLLPAAAATICRVQDLFRDHWPASADLWLPRGDVPAAGSVHRNPAYAALLRRLAGIGGGDRRSRIDAARTLWRAALGAACDVLARPHRHSDGRDHAGVITRRDIDEFEAGYERPVRAGFRGRTVVKAGAWSQGPALLEALRILEPFDDADLDPSTVRGAHLVVETLKLVLADRDAYFGDGADAASLLTDDVVAERRGDIAEQASTTWRPASLPGREPWRPPLRDIGAPRHAATGEPTVARSGETRGDTCHIDVVDRWGNIVSVTPSGGWLQSSPTIPELGFCLGTRLQMCWLDESSPSALRAGSRPRTTLSPTLVEDGDTIIAMGTPGGDQQDQWQLPMLLRMLVGGYSAQQAIDAPTLHTTAMIDSFWPRTWTPAGVVVEDRLGDHVLDGLTARGHEVTRAGAWTLGRLSAVGVDRRTGEVWAAANARGMQGYAAGR
ncbi:gamma-glutamyltransferase family protein [Microbacterium sp. EYE_5]|uniref:gamma-glutamyltransferase family protein n=1 Tax=unclassified Microbacterium TaxID=2609290 RepID=UPI00200501EC|nr:MULTISPECIES: gamma-glutamyltransferase [unclassified Microbacterium]MCK6081029.1 gamma-glutamyltransferase family protein [Microbacterium sp. EYE_382]MCK6086299.1 gamma-glutamyltransferase family protein [Microbacterium sp. EYE_384]MCK6124203.1 gamma-glutamyltransferase family protein [Microbacterium sp. EYE_80]MCK6127112.1 gamma-glutamyltransferase family protein [Microbacterium sp. EYE_79]MCK6141984.1 gamma-glutamyltransferase family protein [Microbacterium sp. EYE_39]